MASSARTTLTIDPAEGFRVSVHPDGITTNVDLGIGSNGLAVRHWEHSDGRTTPEEFATWLRAVADEVDAQWAAYRDAQAAA